MRTRCGILAALGLVEVMGCGGTEGGGTPATGTETASDASSPATGGSSDATADPAATATSGNDPLTGATADPTSEGATETEGGCIFDLNCEGTTPFCVDMQCVACTATRDPNAACMFQDEAHGLCSPSGVCVQCLPTDTSACSGEQPICDPSTVECRGCIAHDECPSGACEYATGECFDEEVDGGCVRHVGLGQPYATVDEAIPGNANKRCLVWMHGDPGFHNESLLIDNARRIAILVEFGDDVQFDGTDGPAVTVTDGAQVYLRGMRMRALSAEQALVVSGGADTRLYVDETELANGFSGGVAVEAGGYLRLVNSLVAGGGEVGAVMVASGSAEIVDTTLIGGAIDHAALTCGATGQATVRNSIVMSRNDLPEVDCDDLAISYSATETNQVGKNNAVLGDMDDTWFVNIQASDLHLSASGAGVFADIARWTTGDPLSDIDGEPRAGADGVMEHAGADVP